MSSVRLQRPAKCRAACLYFTRSPKSAADARCARRAVTHNGRRAGAREDVHPAAVHGAPAAGARAGRAGRARRACGARCAAQQSRVRRSRRGRPGGQAVLRRAPQAPGRRAALASEQRRRASSRRRVRRAGRPPRPAAQALQPWSMEHRACLPPRYTRTHVLPRYTRVHLRVRACVAHNRRAY